MTEVKLDGKQFEVFYDGRKAGLMQFRMHGEDVIVITHTEVDEAYGGKGLGKDLVRAGVEYARENNFKIVPLCPFAKKVIEKTPEFKDILE